MKRNITILLLLILGIAAESFGASVRISSSAARGKRSIEVGDMFYIEIEVSDIDAAPERPSNVPGAKLMYFERTGQSSSFTSVNGHTSQRFSYTYTATLRAQKEGTFSYGPISVGGVKSNRITYSIGKETAHSSSGSGSYPSQGGQTQDSDKPKYIGKGDSNLFLRANVSSTTAYEQQALVYTVKLYTSYDAIKFIGATAAPKFDGFVIEDSKDISNSLSYETFQGKTYATAVIAKYIIFPQMTGNLKITGNTYTVSVDQREYYHDPFFGSMSYSQPLQLNVTPNDLVINVKSLPEPKPADFSGGVGSFRISSQLKNKEFKANQAASIVYKVTGTGNIKYVQLPDLSALYPPEIEIYTPNTTQDVSVGGANVSGSVSFDYSFMPLEEGDFRIPDVKLVYFNPSTGKYETSVAKGYTIHVGKGSAESSSHARRAAKFDSELSKVNISDLRKSREPWIYSFPYWLWFIIPVVLLVGSSAFYRHYVNSHADMVAFNSRRADKIARRRLRAAAAAMKRSDREAFYNEILVALWGYLGDKLKMPTSELLRDNIRQVLSERDIDAKDIDDLIALIDDAEFAKYSSAGGKENIDSDYRRAIDIINRLEKDFKK